MARITMPAPRNAAILAASVTFLVALTPTINASATTSNLAIACNLPTTPSTITTLTARVTPPEADNCPYERRFDLMVTGPCGPWSEDQSREADAFMDCMRNPGSKCNGGDIEDGRIGRTCKLHPELPACNDELRTKKPNAVSVGARSNVSSRSDISQRNIIKKFACKIGFFVNKKSIGCKCESDPQNRDCACIEDKRWPACLCKVDPKRPECICLTEYWLPKCRYSPPKWGAPFEE